LPFQILTPEETIVNVPLCETNLKNIANSCFVGAPTKCIKREKMVLFPENTLMEDAVQHIAQVDNIETFDNFKNLFFVYNKQNTHSTSTDQKQQNAK
jgi:nitrate reductase NapAB chaperone NapD